MSNKSNYDFLQEVFEWVFYNMPIHANNNFMRKLYDSYQNRGGLSRRQLQALLDKVNSINITPSFNPATLEAMIKKKGFTYRSPIPVSAPEVIVEDTSSKEIISGILALAPTHKAALFYQVKLDNKEKLTPAEQDDLKRFLKLLTEARKK